MYIDWKRCRCPLPGMGSGNEIEWIWHLEYALGVAAAEIAILISDVGDNGKTRILDFLAAGRLEFLTRRFVVGLFQGQIRHPSYPAAFKLFTVASRWSSRRVLMKNIATPFALAVLKSLSVRPKTF